MHLLKDENGNVIPHGDGPAHKHEHDHDHGCEEHACDGCSGGSDKCKNESVALLNYMVDHNEHHAAELDQMADNLAKLGMDTAAKQIKEASFKEKGKNYRFSVMGAMANGVISVGWLALILIGL